MISPSRGQLRPTVLVLAVLAVLLALAGADRVIVNRAQAAIAHEVGTALGVPVQARVQGPVAGLRLLALGEVSRLQLHARVVPVPEAGVTLDHLEVTVRDLRLEGREVPVAGRGTFVASLEEAEVQAGAPEGLGGLVRLGDSALLLDIGLTAIPLDVTVVDGALRLEVPGGAPLVDQLLGDIAEVPLATPDGVVVTAAQVRAGVLLLSGTVDPVIVAAG